MKKYIALSYRIVLQKIRIQYLLSWTGVCLNLQFIRAYYY